MRAYRINTRSANILVNQNWKFCHTTGSVSSKQCVLHTQPDEVLSSDATQSDEVLSSDATQSDEVLSSDATQPDEVLSSDATQPDGVLSSDVTLPDEVLSSDATQPGGVLGNTDAVKNVLSIPKMCNAYLTIYYCYLKVSHCHCID